MPLAMRALSARSKKMLKGKCSRLANGKVSKIFRQKAGNTSKGKNAPAANSISSSKQKRGPADSAVQNASVLTAYVIKLYKIIAKKIPAKIAYEDEWVLAFHDVNPQAPVHVLVIPKNRVSRFAELQKANAQQVGEFFTRVAAVASKLDLDVKGYRIVINNGEHGQQTVEYLHAHIIGGRQLHWPPG